MALLVFVLAILAGLYLFLWLAPDYAPFYAAAVLAVSGCAIWLLGRRNGNFQRWRTTLGKLVQAERQRKAWALANPDLPRVKRQSRLIGLALTATGVLLSVAIGAAVLLGELRAYRYMVLIPMLFLAAGLWMLVTGRQPGPRCADDGPQ